MAPKQNATPDIQYLRPGEVARMLGLSRSMVYNLCLNGTLPSIKIGNAVRINARALEQWCKQQEKQRLEDTEVLRYR